MTLRSVALWCIAVGRPRLDRVGRAPAPSDSWSSRNERGYESATTWISLSFMDRSLCRRLMPRSKLGRSRPTTAPATPATFRMVHLQVIGREQMAIAANIGYGHGLEEAFQGKAHHISFGCSKARPRYHFQRFAPSCTELPRRAALFSAHALTIACCSPSLPFQTRSACALSRPRLSAVSALNASRYRT